MDIARVGIARVDLARLGSAALLLAVPFAFCTLPPLTDVPGHIGRFAVQTAAPGDPVLRWFAFHWALVLNLASDALVQLLHPAFGIVGTTRLLCAATPVLTAFGTLLLARMLNRGAAALPWALLYAWSYPFLWGFLNFALTVGMALIGVAGWIGLAGRPRWRAFGALVVVPLLLVGHGVAGVLGMVLVLAYETGRAAPDGDVRRGTVGRTLGVTAPVLLATAVTLLVWHWVAPPGNGPTLWLAYRKGEALIMALRDQDAAFDIGSVMASLAVLILGRRWGARFARPAGLMVLAVALLFLATPSLLSGSDRLDTRLAPDVLLLALALQDWSAVAVTRRRVVQATGMALLVARLTVTSVSFAGYDARYRAELAALDHVEPGARVLAFAPVDCVASGWRSERLEHLPALATLYRRTWVNAHWSIGGLQLLQVRYRPDARFWRDPSQLVWPETCVDRHIPPAEQDRITLIEAVRAAPLAKVNYLWLVGQHLPPSATHRLRLIWRGPGELYETMRNE